VKVVCAEYHNKCSISQLQTMLILQSRQNPYITLITPPVSSPLPYSLLFA
jgi:hypothetical protein